MNPDPVTNKPKPVENVALDDVALDDVALDDVALDDVALDDVIDRLQTFQGSFITASVFESSEISSKLDDIKTNFLDWNMQLVELEKQKSGLYVSGSLWKRYIEVLRETLIIVETVAGIRDNVIAEGEREDVLTRDIQKLTVMFSLINDKALQILRSRVSDREKLRSVDSTIRRNLDVIERRIDDLVKSMPVRYTELTGVSKMSMYIQRFFTWVLYIGIFLHHKNYLEIIKDYRDLEWYDILFRIVSGSVIVNFTSNPVTHFRVAEATRGLILGLLRVLPIVNVFVRAGENSLLISNTLGFFYWALWPMIYDFYMISIRLVVYTRAVIVTSTVEEYINQIYNRYVGGVRFDWDITRFQDYIVGLFYKRVREDVGSWMDPQVYWRKYCKTLDKSLPANLQICKHESKTAVGDRLSQTILHLTGKDVFRMADATIRKVIEASQEQPVLSIGCDKLCDNEWKTFEQLLKQNMDTLGFSDIYQETYKASSIVGYREYIRPQHSKQIVGAYLLWMTVMFIVITFVKTRSISQFSTLTKRKLKPKTKGRSKTKS